MSMGGYQHNDKPLFTAPFGKERIGPSIAVKKNKEHEIVLPVLPSAQSPSSTYEGPGEALCKALQGRMGLRLVALKEMKPELKPSKCNQKKIPFIWTRLGSVSWQLVCQTLSWKPTGRVGLWFTATILSGGSGGLQLLITPIPMALGDTGHTWASTSTFSSSEAVN